MSEIQINENHVKEAENNNYSCRAAIDVMKNRKIGIFDVEYVFQFGEWLFERCEIDTHKYRVILSLWDYDYVEDEELIKQLDIAWLARS